MVRKRLLCCSFEYVLYANPAVLGKEYEETPFPPKRGFSCDCPDKMDLCSFSESDLVCGSGSRHDLVVSLFEGKYLTCRFIELIGC